MDINASKNQLREMVTGSSLSETSKERAYQLIADDSRDFSEIKREIVLLISDDIEKDLQNLGDDGKMEADAQTEEARRELDSEMTSAKDDLESDMNLVNETLDKLAQGAEEGQADAVSQSLKGISSQT